MKYKGSYFNMWDAWYLNHGETVHAFHLKLGKDLLAALGLHAERNVCPGITGIINIAVRLHIGNGILHCLR